MLIEYAIYMTSRAEAQGKRIAMARRRINLEQEDVAKLLGVSQTIVSRIETGKMPGNKHLEDLSTILKVPVEWITTGYPRQEWEGIDDEERFRAPGFADIMADCFTEQDPAAEDFAKEIGRSLEEVLAVADKKALPPSDPAEAKRWAEALGFEGRTVEHLVGAALIVHSPLEVRRYFALQTADLLNGLVDEQGHPVGNQKKALPAAAVGIPVAGVVTAGEGWVRGTPDSRDRIVLRNGLQAIRIEGSSAEPVVLDGQWVLADPQINGDRIKIDALVVVQTDGEAYCKRWAGIHDGKMFLASVHEGRGSKVIPAEGAIAWKVVGTLFPEAVKRILDGEEYSQ